MDLSLLLDLGRRAAPGLAAGAALLAVLPARALEVRLFVYIGLFVLVRDAMTPVGLWSLSPLGVLRFRPDPAALYALAGLSLAMVVVSGWLDPQLRALVVHVKGRSAARTVGAGVLGAIGVALPVAIWHEYMHAAAPAPAYAVWPAIAALAFLGNYLEEVLFRGYFQGQMERYMPPGRAIWASGLFFGFCHAFLVGSVANLGPGVLGFTVFEGLAAAWLRTRFGLLAAALAHGGAVFLLATGLA